MKITCPHCSQTLELEPEVLAALQGQPHFACPRCKGLMAVPKATQPSAAPRRTGPNKPASTITTAQRGLNRNLLVLGVVTLLILGGVAAFLASKNGGNIFNTFQNITNQIIHNSYFTQLIADGVTTEKDLEAIAEIRPYGDGFIGVSKDAFNWGQAQDLANRTGAQILAVDEAARDTKPELLTWLSTTFSNHLSAPTWVWDQSEANVLTGVEVLAVKELDGPKKVLLHWQGGENGTSFPPDRQTPRQIAEWAISYGGGVTLVGGTQVIKDVGNLPAGDDLKIEALWCASVDKKDRFVYADLLPLQQLKHLRKLDIRSQRFGDQAAKWIAKTFPQLTLLTLHDSGLTDGCMASISTLTNLEFLDVAYNHGRITDVGASHLINLQKLERLEVYTSGITDKTLVEVCAKLPRLKWIHLFGTKVTDAGVAEFKRLSPQCEAKRD
ncbi:MAG: hypothetical protein IT576_21730 [Verrucomicrobiales bacterium]|nr:hypothetical protein [Verrucomicrobiales bacterium]